MWRAGSDARWIHLASEPTARLPTVRTVCDLRTIDISLRGISWERSTPELDGPTEILRAVLLRRRPNAEPRTREHLTAGKVETLIEAAKANRYGHRDATMILLAFRIRLLPVSGG